MPFEQVTAPDGVVWRRSTLLHEAGLPHGFSTRLGGVSPAPFDSLNLGLADAPGEPDEWSRVQENWRRFMQAVGLQDRRLVRARQVHGATTLSADTDADAVRDQPPFRDGDALVTTDPAQALAVRVADCAPVLLADPVARVVAAVHAGWRGTVGGIVGEAIRAMQVRGARSDRMVAAIGACIGFEAFQVGGEVREAFAAAGLQRATGEDAVPGKWRVDLRGALACQLVGAGIEPARIDVDQACTFRSTETQFSYRRDGPRSGRMACIIGL